MKKKNHHRKTKFARLKQMLLKDYKKRVVVAGPAIRVIEPTIIKCTGLDAYLNSLPKIEVDPNKPWHEVVIEIKELLSIPKKERHMVPFIYKQQWDLLEEIWNRNNARNL